MKRKLLIHAWNANKEGGDYFLPYSHFAYLREIAKYFEEVVLLSPSKSLTSAESEKLFCIKDLPNVSVYEVPPSLNGYIGSLKHFLHYLNAYRFVDNVTFYYARYPTPFGWLQKIYGRKATRVIHYVGDPVDAAKNNPNFNFFKKCFLIGGFFFEDQLYRWACKGAKVYANGEHLSESLREKMVSATPLVSSTLTEKDFVFLEKKSNPRSARFVYLGNLRTAKGVDVLINAFAKYNEKYPESRFDIVGSGDFERRLKDLTISLGAKNIRFLGRIDDRKELNKILRESDVFLFASFSEGSPRVVLEAMANGLAVISTPVGSLPTNFEDGRDILFAKYNDHEDFFLKMEALLSDNALFGSLRKASYNKAKSYTLGKFIHRIFNE